MATFTENQNKIFAVLYNQVIDNLHNEDSLRGINIQDTFTEKLNMKDVKAIGKRISIKNWDGSFDAILDSEEDAIAIMELVASKELD